MQRYWYLCKAEFFNSIFFLVSKSLSSPPINGVPVLPRSVNSSAGEKAGSYYVYRVCSGASRLTKYLQVTHGSSVVDPYPDPDWIQVQWGHWIRILEGKNDPQKNWIKFFAYCVLKGTGTFTSFFTDKGHKEVTKQYKSRVFYYFCLIKEGFGSGYGTSDKRIWEAQKLTDQDPEHCFLRWSFMWITCPIIVT